MAGAFAASRCFSCPNESGTGNATTDKRKTAPIRWRQIIRSNQRGKERGNGDKQNQTGRGQGAGSGPGGSVQSGKQGQGRGFASKDEDRQREIASQGGRDAHAGGRAHTFTSE